MPKPQLFKQKNLFMQIVLLMRSMAFCLSLSAFTMPYATFCLLTFPFLSIHYRYRVIVGWCRVTLWLLQILCGITHRIKGFENLPQGPAVLLSKHQSAWETLAFPALMPNRLCFVFKRELLFIPFFGWTLGLLGMLHINRTKAQRALTSLLEQGRKKLGEGAWIIMFPEGTRTPTGVKNRYKAGGARLAIETGVPVIPIALNTGRVWPHDTFLKYPGVVTVSIGMPIATKNLTPEQVNSRVKNWIEDEMQRIDAS
jgi:1-acyl-sn-glycerol-3-phosphate acyltransferase